MLPLMGICPAAFRSGRDFRNILMNTEHSPWIRVPESILPSVVLINHPLRLVNFITVVKPKIDPHRRPNRPICLPQCRLCTQESCPVFELLFSTIFMQNKMTEAFWLQARMKLVIDQCATRKITELFYRFW